MVIDKKEKNLEKKMKKNIKGSIKENVLKNSNTLEDWPEIIGYDFEKEFNFEEFLRSYLKVGFGGTSLGQSIEVIKNMRRDKAKIFFAFTSNMGTCGIRDNITYLVKNNFVDVLTTTVGAIEEDIIKCFKPFVLGNYNAVGSYLREEGINRTGNIFIPNDRYIYFDKFMSIFLKRIYELSKKEKRVFGIREFIFELGHEMELQNVVNKEQSFTYWAYKNNMPFFCPALLDGSLGDMVYFFKKNYKDFIIDTSDYIIDVTDLALNCDKMGIIAIGGSVPKHVVANAGLFRDGCEYAVYINTGGEAEGSNAGAPIDEAVSWGKIKADAQKVKVEADASIVFPLIVAGAFKLFDF